MQAGQKNAVSRREFVRTAAVAAAATSAFPCFVRGGDAVRPLKVGVVGCGGRGTDAARDCVAADPDVRVVALADVFQDQLDKCRNRLAGEKTHIDQKNCFVGMDACQKLLETDVDYVILATPPYFRPEHSAACIKAGKHIFMEKPAAVDPVGCRRIMEVGQEATRKGLSIVAGTHRRHQRAYIETLQRIHQGAIGEIVAGQCYFNNGAFRPKDRDPKWSDLEWMLRNWGYWAWLSGDHVVEQHVHNLDVINWSIGKHVEKVVAMGGRARRVVGDQYDFFAADLFYPNDVHVLSQCRQINGTVGEISERVVGTKGASNCNGLVGNLKVETKEGVKPYVQEHIDLIAAIRSGKPRNEAQALAESTLTAVMIRMSAYTGKAVTWEQAMKSDLTLKQPDYELTEENVLARVPMPGWD